MSINKSKINTQKLLFNTNKEFSLVWLLVGLLKYNKYICMEFVLPKI